MAPSKRSAEIMTDPMEPDISDTEVGRPARRQRTSDSPATDGESRPRFATRILPAGQPRGPPPPEPTSAVPASHPFNVPHVAELQQKHQMESVNVSRNCNMRPKIKDVQQKLLADPSEGQKPLVLTISAREDAANKLLSIVEIAKRALDEQKVTWYQYTAAWGRLELFPGSYATGNTAMEAKFGPGRRLEDGALVSGHEDGDADMGNDAGQNDTIAGRGQDAAAAGEAEDSQHFQVMEETQRARVRQISLMTIYLSREPVTELRTLYGEQTLAESLKRKAG